MSVYSIYFRFYIIEYNGYNENETREWSIIKLLDFDDPISDDFIKHILQDERKFIQDYMKYTKANLEIGYVVSEIDGSILNECEWEEVIYSP